MFIWIEKCSNFIQEACIGVGMGDKTQIHIQVDKERKAKWRGYAEEHPDIGNDSLSALIRSAVMKEVEGLHGASSRGRTAATVDLSSVEEQHAQTEKALAELRNVVDRMDTRLNEVQRDVSATAQKQSLKDRLWQSVPPAKPFTEPWERASPDPIPKDSRKWEVAWSGRLEDIAIVARDAEKIVEDQLQEMPIETGEIDGETRYWWDES
jgi:hypothetical protein